MSTKRLAIRGVAFNWLGQGCAFVITFVVTPILIHSLGNGAYGIWCIVMSLTNYYALADFGLRGAAVKYISQFDAVNDREAVKKVVATSLTIYALLALIVLLIVFCVAMVFPLLFEVSQIASSTLWWVVLLTGTSVAVAILGQLFDATLAATKRFDYSNISAVSTQLLQAVLMVVVVTHGGGLLGMACVTLFVSVLRLVLTWILASRALTYLSLSWRSFEWKTAQRLLRFGALFLTQGIGLKVAKSAGAILVGVLLGPALVTFYAIAEGLTNKSGQLSQGIGKVLMPIASQLEAQDRRSDLLRAFLLASRLNTALSVALAVVFVVLGSPLIDLWIGPGYADSAYPVLCILAMAMVVQKSTMGARSILRGTNYVGVLALVGLVDVVLTLALGVVFLNLAGLVGMAHAVLCSQVVTAGLLIPFFACRSLRLSVGRFVSKGLVPGVVAACPGLVVALTMVTLAPPVHIVHVIAQALLIAFVTGVCTFFVCFDEKTRLDILHSLFGTGQKSRRERTAAPIGEEPCQLEGATSEDAPGFKK